MVSKTQALCSATTKSGAPCRARSQADSGYCIHHDPKQETKRAEARKLGGKVRGDQLRQPPPTLAPIAIDKPEDVRVLLVDTVNQLRAGSMTTRVAGTVGYLAAGLMKSFDLAPGGDSAERHHIERNEETGELRAMRGEETLLAIHPDPETFERIKKDNARGRAETGDENAN